MHFSLTNTEKDILELLWEKKSWMSGADFWDYFNQQGRNFKRQTVNTYLSRMTGIFKKFYHCIDWQRKIKS